MQRGFFFSQPALIQNVTAAVVQHFQRFVKVAGGVVGPVSIFQLARRVVPVVFQVVGWRLERTVVVSFGCRVERHIMTGQAAFHLAHFARLYAEAFSHTMHFIVVQPGQTFFLAAQVEEQFALSLGGRDFHDPPVAQDKFVDLCLDPVHRKRHQTHTHFRVEAFDRLHQADVAFLDQVSLSQAIARITTGNVYNKTQVGEHHLPSRPQILLIVETLGQFTLLLRCQQWNAVHRIDIGLEVRTRDQRIRRLQRSGHTKKPPSHITRAVQHCES